MLLSPSQKKKYGVSSSHKNIALAKFLDLKTANFKMFQEISITLTVSVGVACLEQGALRYLKSDKLHKSRAEFFGVGLKKEK